jgi:cell division protein FtsQ
MHVPRPPRVRRPPIRAVVGCAAVLALLGGAWLWLRDSSLVAVRQVSVTGLTGPDAPRVRAALQDAALDMTTLHVRAKQLTTAVEPFPAVEKVEAHADFPHKLRIVVHEHAAVGAIAAGSQRLAVAGDGTLLRGTPTQGLPTIAIPVSPGGDRLADRAALRAAALLAMAPAPLRAKIRRVYMGQRGLTVPLQNGPVLYFGGADRLRAKWTAATVVLADRSASGATYLDLRLPERPAAGGLESTALDAEQPADGAAQSQTTQPQTSQTPNATAQP